LTGRVAGAYNPRDRHPSVTGTSHVYQFGPYRLDEHEQLLYRQDRPVPLPPKAVQTLVVLLRHAGATRRRGRACRKWRASWASTTSWRAGVRSAGESVRVTAQLIETRGQTHLWAQSYDRKLGNVVGLQAEVATAIAPQIGLRLGPRERDAGRPAPTNAEAYDAYLRGKFRFRAAGATSASRGELEEAIGLLERATIRDPGVAPGHAALANAYAFKFFYADPGAEWEEKAYTEIERALALDPDLADAHLARANLIWTLRNSFPHERAVEEYRTAIRLDPNLAEAHTAIARLYEHIGLLDQALAELAIATRLDPANPEASVRTGLAYLEVRGCARARSPSAISAGRRRRSPSWRTSFAAIHRSGHARSTRCCSLGREIVRRRSRRSGKSRAPRGTSGATRAITTRSTTWGRRMRHWASRRWPSRLRKAADEGFPCYPFYAHDPHLGPLKGEPAFEAFLADLKGQWEQRRLSFAAPY
jgi:hypothetical protein